MRQENCNEVSSELLRVVNLVPEQGMLKKLSLRSCSQFYIKETEVHLENRHRL